MEQKGVISIVVPVYKVEKYLDRCMTTLLRQTYKNIEIILVDDGSPDGCPKLCDEYEKKDSRVKVVHKENGGLGLARNSGLDIATGEYIAFVDSDDYVTEDMCEKLMSAATEYHADIVYGGIFYDENGVIKRRPGVQQPVIWKDEAVKDFLLDLIAMKPEEKQDTIIEVSVWKAIFRKRIFDDHSIRFVSEREFISEDIIFDIDYISKARSVVLIPDPVYYYCTNPNSLSKSFRTDRFERTIIMYLEIKRKLEKLYKSEAVEERCDRYLIANARTNMKSIVRHKSVIGKQAMYEAMDSIYNEQEFRNVLRRYPIHKLPLKYMAIAFLMRMKCRLLLCLVLGMG